MTGELQPRIGQQAALETYTQQYDPSRMAGVWEHRPFSPPDLMAFVTLSISKHAVPLRSVPLYRMDAGTTSTESRYPLTPVQPDDDYSKHAEEGVVQIVPKRLLSREKLVQIWIARFVEPLKLFPPVVAAADTFLTELDVDWRLSALRETDINDEFMTLKAPVPSQKIQLELGGPPLTVPAAAIIAATTRLVAAETYAISDGRRILDSFMKRHPDEAVLTQGGNDDQQAPPYDEISRLLAEADGQRLAADSDPDPH